MSAKTVVLGEQLDLFGGPSTPVVWSRDKMKKTHARGVVRGLQMALGLALALAPIEDYVAELEALLVEWRNK